MENCKWWLNIKAVLLDEVNLLEVHKCTVLK